MVGRWNSLFGWPIFRGHVSFREGTMFQPSQPVQNFIHQQRHHSMLLSYYGKCISCLRLLHSEIYINLCWMENINHLLNNALWTRQFRRPGDSNKHAPVCPVGSAFSQQKLMGIWLLRKIPPEMPSRQLTYSFPRTFESMIFLFPRWDMWSFPVL